MDNTITLQRGTPEQVGMNPARIELIRDRARGWVADGDMPSLVLLVARKGVVVLEETFGTRGPPDNEQLRTSNCELTGSSTRKSGDAAGFVIASSV